MEFPHLLLAAVAASSEITTDWDSPGVIFIKLLAILALVLLNGFFVASEFAIVKVRSSQIDTIIDQSAKSATRARKVVSHLDEYLSATQLGITLASLGLGWIGEPFLAAMLEPIFVKAGITSPVVIHTAAFALAFSIITYLHIVLGELTPKSLAIRRALQITILISGPIRLFYLTFKPFIRFLNGNANFILRHVFKVEPAGGSELAHSEEELRLILAESQKSDEVSSLGREIVINALDLKHRIVRDIMTPRGDVIYLDIDEPFETEITTAMESRHTRFPLCREHLDDAIGLVHIKDLLALVRENRQDLDSIKRDLLHVSEMMPLEKLLRFFLTKHAHMAVSVDEYGGAVGIVTLDNVLEELVGDIQDEFDIDEHDYRKINEREFETDGTHSLYELEEKLDTKFDEADVTTIGGYVTSELGHLPVIGETVRIDNWLATVAKSDNRRVLQVHFKKDPIEEPKPAKPAKPAKSSKPAKEDEPKNSES